MTSHEPCTFCDGLLGAGSNEPWDEVLFASADTVIVPTKGCLVPGWLLVVPKEHALRSCEASQPSRDGLLRALSFAQEAVERSFGAATLVEHGPNRHGSPLGCGVNHVHFHVIPLGFSLCEAIRAVEPEVTWRPVHWPAQFSQTAPEYILVREPGEPWRACDVSSPQRQLTRRAIAAKLGIPEMFDYASFPFAANARLTARTIRRSAA